MLCSAKEKFDPVAETACLGDTVSFAKTSTVARLLSILPSGVFEASHTIQVRSAGPFCVKMFNSLQACSDQLLKCRGS
jgi:hypothetical protein